MNGKITYIASVVLGGLALLLLIVNVAIITSNRHMQDSVNQRQADLNKATSLSNVNQSLVQALAEAAVNENDTAIKDLLAQQGITFNPAALKKK